MPQSFNYRPPATQGINNLADTIGAMLDARNQRLASEQKAQMDAIKEGYDTLNKTTTILSNRDLHPSIKKSALEQYNSKINEMKRWGVNINPLPTDIDFSNPSFDTVVKQIKAAPKALESGVMQFSELPDYLNRVTQDYSSGANDKDRAFIEKMVKDVQKDESGKQFGTLANVMSKPESMGKTPEDQNSIVTQMVANLRGGDREAATDLWKMWEEKQKAEKGFKFTGASVFRGEDGNWWRWNPTSGLPEVYQKTKGGKYDFAYDPNRPVPDAVSKELGRTPATAMEKGVTLDQIAGNLGRIRGNFNPSWVGPVAGRAYRMQEAVTGLKDDNQSAFYADVNDIGDMLLRARSGAQINEQEYARLRRLVPTPDLPPKVFNERMGRFEKQFTQAIEAWERRLSGGRYIVPKQAPQTKNVVNKTNAPNEMQIGGFKVRVKQ